MLGYWVLDPAGMAKAAGAEPRNYGAVDPLIPVSQIGPDVTDWSRLH
jgi:hypothetical protein